MQKTIAKLFDVHQNTVSNWKKENKPGLNLILKYFSKQELEEFLETEKIEKQELIKAKTTEEIQRCFQNKHNEQILAQIKELEKQLL